MFKTITYVSCLLLLASCDINSNDEPDTDDYPEITGTQYGISTVTLDEAYNALITALEGNDQINIMAELDHSQNAGSVDLELGKTQIVFFGNPSLGTPLMQQNQLAGLDLPQKVLFFENMDKVFAIYNSVDYLEYRYSLGGVESLSQISSALESLVGAAIQNDINRSTNQSVSENEGVITVISKQGFEATYQSLKGIISANENLSIVAEVDHQENAESRGLELNPTKLIIFGNPNLGTPLMQASQTTGLDLPQKILVWENAEGEVFLSYNDPEFLKKRHQIEGKDMEIQQITTALENLTITAAEEN